MNVHARSEKNKADTPINTKQKTTTKNSKPLRIDCLVNDSYYERIEVDN